MEKNVKKLSGIKLNYLSKNELEKRKMNALLGGTNRCDCGSCYCKEPIAPSGAMTDALDQAGSDPEV